jgi:S-formylglutathione hydrolase
MIKLACAALIFAALTCAQSTGTIERIKVHGKALEGNLEGDSPDRDVSIYLPPGYRIDKARRYPVIYMLHGFTDSDDRWFGLRGQHWINLPQVLDKSFARPGARQMIVVMPNAYTRYQGSMYSNSVTTGNWEDFVAGDLVAYIDSRYRTLARAESRGLAGHSMGGYGAARIGMRHPGVFSAVYLLSPCCMTPPDLRQPAANIARAEAIKDPAEVDKADFGVKAALASAAAWSPNPKNPPLYFDLLTRDGQFQPAIAAKWAANAPLAMIDQYIANLKRLRGLAFDAGASDKSIAASIKVLDQILNDYGIAHGFEIYDGDHLNHIADRVETKMIPFFSEKLSFGAGK